MQTYIRFRYDETELYLGYVYTDVKQNFNSQHTKPIATPMHNLAATFFYDLTDNLVLGIESSYIANQLDENYNATKNYYLLAAMIRYNIGNLSFVLNGENLLDFRQSKYEKIYDGTINEPVFHKLWAPIDGRVINLSIKWTIK